MIEFSDKVFLDNEDEVLIIPIDDFGIINSDLNNEFKIRFPILHRRFDSEYRVIPPSTDRLDIQEIEILDGKMKRVIFSYVGFENDPNDFLHSISTLRSVLGSGENMSVMWSGMDYLQKGFESMNDFSIFRRLNNTKDSFFVAWRSYITGADTQYFLESYNANPKVLRELIRVTSENSILGFYDLSKRVDKSMGLISEMISRLNIDRNRYSQKGEWKGLNELRVLKY